DLVVEIAELALVPHFDRAVVAVPVLADPHPLGAVAIGAEGRGPRRADPFAAALVALLLLLQALAQRLHQLVPAAERLDLPLLLVRQVPLAELAQPLLGNGDPLRRWCLQPLEAAAEDAVELVEI